LRESACSGSRSESAASFYDRWLDSLHDTRAVAPPPQDRFACYTFSKMCWSRIMCRGEALPSGARLEGTRVTVPRQPYGVLR
jgi:hypothetical protein